MTTTTVMATTNAAWCFAVTSRQPKIAEDRLRRSIRTAAIMTARIVRYKPNHPRGCGVREAARAPLTHSFRLASALISP